MAGRREVPVDPGAGPVQRFAFELRKLRTEAGGLTYRAMATRAGYSITTLSQAAGGEQLPTLPVALAFAGACGGDLAEWESRWHRAVEEAAAFDPENEGADAAPPYRGLARFETGDSGLFFGRDGLTAELAALLGRRRFAAVFGPSGIGKSSLLRAGLIPVLRESGERGSRLSGIRILTPGDRLSRTHELLRRASAPGDGAATGDTLVVVDQFEEVFTLCHDPAERNRFIDLLLTARDPGSRLRVLIAVRADFYGRCAEHRELAGALGDANLLAGPMSPAELREVVVKPAAAAGLTVERALTARLVEEITDAPGGLPLLSHVLLETWRRRRGKTLTLAGYEAAGGLDGAIAKTAEDVYGRFTGAEAVTARRVLLRLITPGDGTPDTRRPADRAELEATGTGREEVAEVLEALTRARLLTLDGPAVDLAHEALITAWPRLRGWIEEDRDRLRAHRQLTEAARAWEELGRDAGALYRGSRLATAREYFGGPRHTDDLTDREAAFLAAGISALDQEERARARSTRRLRVLVGSLACLLALALTATAVAYWQRRTALDAQRDGLSRQLAAQSAALLDSDTDLASLLAIKAYRTSPTREATRSLYAAAAVPLEHRLTGHTATVSALAYSPDGETLASGAFDGTVRLWDPATGRTRKVFGGHAGRDTPEFVRTLAFGPDGRTLVTGGNDEARLWKVGTNRPRATLHVPGGDLRSVAYGPDGDTIATSSDETNVRDGRTRGAVRLWDAATRRPRGTLMDGPADGGPVLFSPDGRTLAVTAGPRGQLWDVATRRIRTTFPVRFVNGMAFSPDGRTLVTVGEGLVLWDARTGRPRVELPEAEEGSPVAFSPTGDAFATTAGSGDGTIRLRDPATGRVRSTLAEPRGSVPPRTASGGPPLFRQVQAMAFGPDGRTLASAESDGKVRLWDTGTGHLDATLTVSLTDGPVELAFSPDGRTLATVGGGAVRLWDTATRYARASFPDGGGTLRPAFSPDGRTLVVGGRRDRLSLWDVDLPLPARAVTGICRAVHRDLTRPERALYLPDGEPGRVC
ncbi:hypothetical protein QBA57_28960 [Streptomyces scabiei]|uniref:nSTAND1 domain-containing NTPase n=1 Tax=Streptomyces scabiei TaxID=1930 RepID=UPI001B31271D|nr:MULTISPECIES: hypothetical protein [Streptomyces]MBP5864030.1 hypothetical protein [Streptomyces sp. LBUM 1484]QTU50861.1 hypothetical protein F3K20_12515 [Streptomyces sp. LBUM 1482]MBP5875345.1 hypothetical protein [Streptomyces sp. LBUM 1477]MBP5883103.1 hypothetical protein [Streptomyces sp. LBUM 1487]MBP5899188.1 hypothetical protein [Streptomyces sp. LBUM 1488]